MSSAAKCFFHVTVTAYSMLALSMFDTFLIGNLLVCIFFNTLRAGVRYIRTWNWSKTSSCQLPYQRHSSSADCTRDLFKGSNGSVSHALEKNVLVGGCRSFVSDVTSKVVFGPFWLMLPGLGINR